jgi:hypothetical protein
VDVFVYVASDSVGIRTKGERLPGRGLIAVDVDTVFLDALSCSEAIALFSGETGVCVLERVLEPQAVFPLPPNVVLVERDYGSM